MRKKSWISENRFSEKCHLRTTKSSATHTPENAAGSGGQKYFSSEISMRLPLMFWPLFEVIREKLTKTLRANELIFQLKNSFVFQTQPRFPEYGSRNF